MSNLNVKGILQGGGKSNNKLVDIPFTTLSNNSATTGRPTNILYTSDDYENHIGETIYDVYSSSLKDSEEAYYGNGYIRPANQDGLVITNFWDSTYYDVRQYLFTDNRILCRHRGGSNKAGFDASKYSNWTEIGIDSIGDNYIRYTNGIQICWGSPSASSSVGYCYITFPQAFSVIPTVMGSATNSDEYKDANYAQNIRVVSKTGCTVNDWMLRGTAQKFNYIAIGKWK